MKIIINHYIVTDGSFFAPNSTQKILQSYFFSLKFIED